MEPGDRWPPVYDAEDLERAIRELARRQDLEAAFFDPNLTRAGPFCQGDVLEFTSGVPIIDADGTTAEIDDFQFWLAIGNTCDFDRPSVERSNEGVLWTQVVPLLDLSVASTDQRRALQAYRPSRRFFVPPWPGMDRGRSFAADFLRPVALHKAAVGSSAKVVARMTREAWILLHGCLIRFLCRDDGRFAA